MQDINLLCRVDFVLQRALDGGMKSLNITDIKNILPVRSQTANKTAGGKCLIIAGSLEMPGAARLAATAAARIGSGYVYLAVEFSHKTQWIEPDFILVDRNKKIDFMDFSAVAIGPGLGKTSLTLKILKDLIKSGIKNVVVDADAINTLAEHKALLPLPPDWIITPHAGELSRILNCKKSIKPEERLKLLKPAQSALGAILLLKGSPTFVSNGKQEFRIKTGNKALAKAGTGDVLTGMIAGLLSQQVSPLKAAVAAATIHGYMADEWIKSRDYLGLMASDLTEAIPTALFQIRNKK